MKIKQTKEGWWIVDQDSHISKWVEESGRLDHAPWLAEMACFSVPEGGVIIDGGANLGSHTLTYSNKVGPKGRVIAFEPGDLAFECLTENVRRFDHGNVTLRWQALSNYCGLVDHVENENLGASRCLESKEGTTQMIAIDEMYEPFGPVALIKLDIEGWELKALKGASQVISKFHPKILLEMNREALKAQGNTYEDIYEFLARNNYDWKICQPDCKHSDPQWDMLATPKL